MNSRDIITLDPGVIRPLRVRLPGDIDVAKSYPTGKVDTSVNLSSMCIDNYSGPRHEFHVDRKLSHKEYFDYVVSQIIKERVKCLRRVKPSRQCPTRKTRKRIKRKYG